MRRTVAWVRCWPSWANKAAISDGNDPAGGKATGHDILFTETGVVYRDDNVTVDAFRTRHALGRRLCRGEEKGELPLPFSPAVLARIATEAKVKTVVLSHEQNYNNARDYQPLGLVDEVKVAGFEGKIYSAMDSDVY